MICVLCYSHVDEVRRECEDRVRDVEAHYQVTIGEYEQQIELLQCQITQVRDELAATKRLSKQHAYGDTTQTKARESKTDLLLTSDCNGDVSNYNENNSNCSFLSEDGVSDFFIMSKPSRLVLVLLCSYCVFAVD